MLTFRKEDGEEDGKFRHTFIARSMSYSTGLKTNFFTTFPKLYRRIFLYDYVCNQTLSNLIT